MCDSDLASTGSSDSTVDGTVTTGGRNSPAPSAYTMTTVDDAPADDPPPVSNDRIRADRVFIGTDMRVPEGYVLTCTENTRDNSGLQWMITQIYRWTTRHAPEGHEHSLRLQAGWEYIVMGRSAMTRLRLPEMFDVETFLPYDLQTQYSGKNLLEVFGEQIKCQQKECDVPSKLHQSFHEDVKAMRSACAHVSVRPVTELIQENNARVEAQRVGAGTSVGAQESSS